MARQHIDDYRELHRELISFDPQSNIALNHEKAFPKYTHSALFSYFADQSSKYNFASLCRNILF